MQTHTITFEQIKAGQARPYADSIYEYNIVFSADRGKDGWSSVWTPTKDMVLKYVLAHNSDCKEKEQAKWWESRLEILEELEKGKWHVKIIQPYLD